MNIQLSKAFSVNCVLVMIDQDPWINTYDVSIGMLVSADTHHEYNCAYGRIKFWLQNIMQDSVLIEHTDQRIKSWRNVGLRCLDLPTTPVDQAIGFMLMSKLNAVTEGRISVQHLNVSSFADDNVTYYCDQTDSLHWFDATGWWNETAPSCSTPLGKATSTGKIIEIARNQDWKDHDLAWETSSVVTGNVSILPTRDRDA